MAGMPGVVVVCALAAVLAAVLLLARARARLRRQRADAESSAQLAVAARVAVEDVDRLGEDLADLEVRLAGRRADEATLGARARAREAYEAARRRVQGVSHSDEIAQVTRSLETGRYAIVCARARMQGRPQPQQRPPCFFNPVHGPSVRDVRWAPAGERPRRVPACRADFERITAGAQPNIRTVPVDGERVPYWQAGPAYAPYARGYYHAWSDQRPLAG